jgi:amidase
MSLLRSTFAALILPLAAHAAEFELSTATLTDINAAFDSGALTSEKLLSLYLARIAAYDRKGPAISAIATLNDRALARARALDAERKTTGPRSRLHGVPVVLKDLIDVAGMPTGYGFKPAGLPIAPRHATVVQRLEDAGAIILAKAATVNWFGQGYNETYHPAPTRNPYNLDYDCGATSSGSGGAIAAGFATVSLGTDTSQSVQNPAARTATVGVVGSFGMVSRAGVMPRSAWHDRVGPITKTVADAATVFSIIAGWDAEDLTTSSAFGHHPLVDLASTLLGSSLQGVRLGVLREMFYDHPRHAEGRAVFEQALADLRKNGAQIIDPILTGSDLKTITGSSFLRLAEHEKTQHANAYLARWGAAAPFKTMGEMMDKIGHDKFSRSMVAALDLPEPDQSEDYLTRFRAVQALNRRLNELLVTHELDGFVLPFSTMGAAKLDGTPNPEAGNSLGSYASLPGVIVPGGYLPSTGLPIGIQFLGRSYSDAQLLRIAHAYEQATRHAKLPATTPALPGEKFTY